MSQLGNVCLQVSELLSDFLVSQSAENKAVAALFAFGDCRFAGLCCGWCEVFCRGFFFNLNFSGDRSINICQALLISAAAAIETFEVTCDDFCQDYFVNCFGGNAVICRSATNSLLTAAAAALWCVETAFTESTGLKPVDCCGVGSNCWADCSFTFELGASGISETDLLASAVAALRDLLRRFVCLLNWWRILVFVLLLWSQFLFF